MSGHGACPHDACPLSHGACTPWRLPHGVCPIAPGLAPGAGAWCLAATLGYSFSAPTPAARAVVQRAGSVQCALPIERSAAIPFLKKPPALDGSMVGDVGFDPLGFTSTITELGGDLNYVRTSPTQRPAPHPL